MHAKGHPPPQRPAAECSPLGPVQKQVWFDLANDLGDVPSLPTHLANFLGENTADEWIDSPCTAAPLTMDPSQLPHNNGHQCCPTQGEPNLKLVLPSLQPPVEPNLGLGGHPTQRIVQTTGSGYSWAGRMASPLVEGAWSSLQGLLGKWLATPIPCNLPDGRLWLSGYSLPRKRHQDGGQPHVALADCVIWTFCPELIPLAWGTSRLLGKKKPWHWPELCNFVQRGWGCLPESCAMQHRAFKGVWHP